MQDFLKYLNQLVWGMPVLMLIIAVGVYLSTCTAFAQLRLLPEAIARFLKRFTARVDSNGKSSYRALCTALAATVGTGNVAGVAGAIAIGGPGAIFWMWICALLGMVTKFAEATLAVRYRHQNAKGELTGGPMYMIEKGMPKQFRWLASLYCFFGVVAAFGVGNATQVNAVIGSVKSAIGASEGGIIDVLLGMILACMTLAMLLGGAKRIGSIAESLVPFAASGYIILCIAALLLRFQSIPGAFSAILSGAFSPSAVTGGAVGSCFTALRIGASRGVFTNEAGMGTASIAHSASNVKHPVEQGMMGIVEVFLDTIVICTLTALVILCSGVKIDYGTDTGVVLTTTAFGSILGEWVSLPIAITVCCFAVATVLGWGLYGIRCAQYLFGDRAWKYFVYLQGDVVLISSVLQTGTIWMLAETVNGLMAIPNLIVLAYLAPELRQLVLEFRKQTLTS